MKQMLTYTGALVILLIVLTNAGMTQTYSWNIQWNNNGSGDISGWAIDATDRYVSGYYLGAVGEMLLCLRPNGWAAVKDWVSAYQNWETLYSNGGGGSFGGWQIASSDRYLSIGVQAQSDQLLCVNPNSHWAAVEWFHYASGVYRWDAIWSNSGNGWIGGWQIGSTESYVAANFSTTISRHELLCANHGSGWAMLQTFTGSAWTGLWNNGGNNTIGGWVMSSDSRYTAGDFDGDGQIELLCVKPSWAAMFRFNGSTWTTVWSNNGNGWIGTWQITSNDLYLAKKITPNSNRDQLMSIRIGGSWAAVNQYSASSWTLKWTNNGNGSIGGWQIGSDKYLLAYFDDAFARLLPVRQPWAMLLKCREGSGTQKAAGSEVNEVVIQRASDAAVLNDPFPNPFNPATTIGFTLPAEGRARITIVDVLGREVRELTPGYLCAGPHVVNWDGNGSDGKTVGSGVFFVRMVVQDEAGLPIFIGTKRLLKIK